MKENVATFAALLRKEGNKAYRRYRLRQVDGRLMLRDEIDRLIDLAIDEAFGTEIEPDEKDGMFLD